MSQVVDASAVTHKDVDLAWMVGCRIQQITFSEPSYWKFLLDHDRAINVECLWRVIAAHGTAVTSEDHNQRFGLPEPVDAASACLKLLATSAITSVRLDEATGDLDLAFGGKLRLEIIATSTGYENWQIHNPKGVNYVAGGHGRISAWKS